MASSKYVVLMKSQMGLFGGRSSGGTQTVRVKSHDRRLESGKVVTVIGHSREQRKGQGKKKPAGRRHQGAPGSQLGLGLEHRTDAPGRQEHQGQRQPAPGGHGERLEGPSEADAAAMSFDRYVEALGGPPRRHIAEISAVQRGRMSGRAERAYDKKRREEAAERDRLHDGYRAAAIARGKSLESGGMGLRTIRDELHKDAYPLFFADRQARKKAEADSAAAAEMAKRAINSRADVAVGDLVEHRVYGKGTVTKTRAMTTDSRNWVWSATTSAWAPAPSPRAGSDGP